MQENPAFLKEQIITYLGNKRALLDFISQGFARAKVVLKRDKFSFLDVFSGSGVVSRFAKAHANFILANDLENYSRVINECYLSNFNENLWKEIEFYHAKLSEIKTYKKGFITELYAPKNEDKIKPGERVFFTPQNARFLDTMRQKINKIPQKFQPFFIAPLIYLASNHTNTGGIFKGFYKDKNGVGKFGGEAQNALKRIKAKMDLLKPIFSNFHCEFEVAQMDALELAKSASKIDVAYLDPPYNQHPYGSNYFMLNLIASYERPHEISKISGITKNWNRSIYNKAKSAENALFELIETLKARVILLSYNCEGFVKKENFEKRLKTLGKCEILEQIYPTFKASRNLAKREKSVKEQLYVLIKD